MDVSRRGVIPALSTCSPSPALQRDGEDNAHLRRHLQCPRRSAKDSEKTAVPDGETLSTSTTASASPTDRPPSRPANGAPRGGKNSATAVRLGKRIPERYKEAPALPKMTVLLQEDVEETRSGLPRVDAVPSDPLTGQAITKLPAGVMLSSLSRLWQRLRRRPARGPRRAAQLYQEAEAYG